VLALLPALIALAGMVLYALAANPKVAELGRLMFGCGLLAVCFALAGKMVRLL
jgi:Na+/phosphate symporter